MDVAPELFSLVPRKIAELHEVVPAYHQNGTLTVAMARAENLSADAAGRRHTGGLGGSGGRVIQMTFPQSSG